MIIVVDRGNTRMKVTLFDDSGKIIATERTDNSIPAGSLARTLRNKHYPQGDCRGIVCNVGEEDGKLMESLMAKSKGTWLELTHSTPLPIVLDYGTPDTLGLDRIAAACGAVRLHPGKTMVIADAGTALTIDIVDWSSPESLPVFRGGNISAGARLRAEALHAHTGRLPLVDLKKPLPSFPFGRDTESAILCGIWGGLTAEIEEAFLMAKKEWGAVHLLLTGGDAERLFQYGRQQEQSGLCYPQTADAEINENLVALGLLHIYEFNIQQ